MEALFNAPDLTRGENPPYGGGSDGSHGPNISLVGHTMWTA